MAKEICEDCGKVFEAGPRAFLCPKCRKERLRKAARRGALARKARIESTQKQAISLQTKRGQVCKNCNWYEPFSGACCNGNSPNCADFMDEDHACKAWEGEKTDENDV